MRRVLRRAAGAALGLSLLIASPAWSESLPAGSLDPTFGENGTAGLGFKGGANDVEAYRTGSQTGKLVTVGVRTGEVNTPFMARLTTDGAIDPTFGDDGFVTDLANFVSDVELLDDGGILVTSEDQIEHYRVDGSYLNTIELEDVEDIHLDRDGADAGTVLYTRGDGPNLRVGRLEVAGDIIWERSLSLKENPGQPEAGWRDEFFRVTDAPRGRVVVAGTHRLYDSPYSGTWEFGVVRLTGAGGFDTSFGAGGGTTHPAGTRPAGTRPTSDLFFLNVTDVHVDRANRILVSAAGSGPASDWSLPAVFRLTDSGQLDPVFSGDGFAFPLSNAGLFEVGEDSKGRILAGGTVESHDTAAKDAGVVRLLEDGTRDSVFGQAGVASIAPNPYPSGNYGFGMDFDPSGVVISGSTGTYPGDPGSQASLTRFLAEPTDDEDGDDKGGVAGGVASSGRGIRVHKLLSPRSFSKLASRGIRALVSCELDCRAVLEVRVSQGAASEMGLPGTLVAKGSRRLSAERKGWVIASLTARAERALRGYTGGGNFKIKARGVAP